MQTKLASGVRLSERGDSRALESPEFERIAAALGGKSADSGMVKEQESEDKFEIPKLNRIAQLILEVDSHAAASDDSKENEIRNHNRSLLAAQLGCTPDDLQAIVESYGDEWQSYVLESRIRLNMTSTHMRDTTWDRLEAATLKKLLILVDNPVVKLSVAELLAVAKTANTANRGDRKPAASQGGGQGGSAQTNIFIGGDPANGVLPAGDLGTISLSLSNRVLRQIAQPKTIEGEGGRVLDSMEMMGIKDIQKIGERMDKEKDESK